MKKIFKLEQLTIKKITILAILMALGVVFKFFSIGDGEFRISFWDIPLFIAGMIAGPIYGGVCALGADLIYGLCFSSYPFSFIMMFTTIIWGVSGGIFHKRTINKKTIIILYVLVFITSLISTFINSIYLTMYYGFASMLIKLPLRLLVLIIKWPITSTLICALYKGAFDNKIFKEDKQS